METVIPKTSAVVASLLKADFTTQWRNRRSVILTLVIPVIILISWKGLVAIKGGAFALSNCITIGLIATGLMGYTNAIARDRDKGIFQRLRVAPIANWTIMGSRIFVQLVMIILITTCVFIAGSEVDKITLTPGGYAFTYFTAIIGGLVYLSLGQMIAGMVTSPETVNSTTRLAYFVFIMVGMFGELGILGTQVHDIEHWSPYGAVKTILAASAEPGKWSNDTSISLLLTVLYAAVFAFIGIQRFKWNTNK
ncbi:MAG: ABC transporter permease [Bacteroidota bacterium]|nr:ABC transporter permease [Bacteroidota bacterium]